MKWCITCFLSPPITKEFFDNVRFLSENIKRSQEMLICSPSKAEKHEEAVINPNQAAAAAA